MWQKRITVPLSIGLGIGVYLVHYVLYKGFNVYGIWPWFDAPMHFIGGMLAGILGGAIYQAGEKGRKGKVHWIIPLCFILGFVAAVAMVWEFHEFLLDAISIYNGGGGRHQASIDDTMKDMALGMAGGVMVYLLVWKMRFEEMGVRS